MPAGHPRIRTAASAGLLFAANALLCRRMFFTPYLGQLGSVDGPQIAMARYVMEHRTDAAWWPWWFCGMPHRNVYGPLMHGLAAALGMALRASPAAVVHTLGALFYCLGPVTLFWLVHRLSGSRLWALASGLLYTAVSPAALLIPSIRADAGGPFYLRRLQNFVVYGEYPHILALCAIPVALTALEALLRRKRAAWYVWTALAFTGIVLASVTGAVGFAMIGLAWFVARPPAEYLKALWRCGLAALLAYGLALPWIPPSTVRLIAMNSQWSLGRPFPFTPWHLLYFGLIAAGAAALCLILARMRAPELLRFSVLLVYLPGSVILTAAFTGVAILPQPLRFQLEFEMGCAIAAGFLVKVMLERAPRQMPAAGALGAVFVLLLALNIRRADQLIRPIDIRQTSEYKVSRWFNRHMGDRRVFAPGSVSLWLNVFGDTPQLGGCCDQGVPSFEQRIALYTVYTGQNTGALDGAVSLLWLQAYGVHAVGVSGPGSGEVFKPFWNPRKFDGLLPLLWRDGGDAIYQVPQRTAALAHVVPASRLVKRPPTDGLDVAGLQVYVAALNDPRLPLASMDWTSRRSARITADLPPQDVLSVQMSYNRGWHAFVQGVERPLTSDALGLIVVHPDCTGPCTVDLRFDGGPEIRIANRLQLAAAVVCALLLLADVFARRRPARRQSGAKAAE